MSRVPFAVCLLLIVGLWLLPSTVKLHLTIGPQHDAGHVLAFFVAALLGFWEIKTYKHRFIRCAGLFALAFGIEGIEKIITYTNPFEWRDVAFDSIGIAAGFFATLLLPARPGISKPTRPDYNE
jgi:hypothetical protein